MIETKKGVAHVEMILAFVLFIVFVVFLLFFLRPFGNDTLEDSILISAKNAFFENTSVSLTTVLVNYDENSEGCKPEIEGTAGLNAKRIDTSASDKFYVYFAESNALEDDGLSTCPEDSYEIGTPQTIIVVSDFYLEGFKNDYESGYEILKNEELGLPSTVDFSILSDLKISGKTYILEERSPEQVKVIAGAYRQQVLIKETGELISKDFIIKVW